MKLLPLCLVIYLIISRSAPQKRPVTSIVWAPRGNEEREKPFLSIKTGLQREPFFTDKGVQCVFSFWGDNSFDLDNDLVSFPRPLVGQRFSSSTRKRAK